jgi:tripartite-type tricarboxylate transporter receptor subunit TctC
MPCPKLTRTTVLSGDIAFTFQHHCGGHPIDEHRRLRALGVTTAQRIAGLDVPTIAESRFPD